MSSSNDQQHQAASEALSTRAASPMRPAPRPLLTPAATSQSAFVRAQHYRGHSLELRNPPQFSANGELLNSPQPVEVPTTLTLEDGQERDHKKHRHHAHEGSFSASAGVTGAGANTGSSDSSKNSRSKTPPPERAKKHSRGSSTDNTPAPTPSKDGAKAQEQHIGISASSSVPSLSTLATNTTPVTVPLAGLPGRFIGAKSGKAFRKRFGLPENTILLYDCMCALYVNSFPYQGHLYLSQFVLCFYCKIFGSEQQKEMIPLKDIRSIVKKQKPILRIGIEVTTADRTYFFASFVKRGRAFKNVVCMWKAVVGEAAAVVLPGPTPAQPSHEMSDVLAPPSSAARAESDSDSDDTSPPDVEAAAAGVVTRDTNSTTPPGDKEEYEDDEVYTEGSVKEGFLGSKLSEGLRESFPMSVTTFFRLYFSNDSQAFLKLFHDDHEDENVQVTKWSHQAVGMLREKHYVAKVKNAPIMSPPTTRVDETQRYSLRRDYCVMETFCVMLDIPYGDYFNVESKYEVFSAGENACELVISIGIKFNKRTLFRPVIESASYKQTKECAARWIQLAKEFAASPAGQAMMAARAFTTPSQTSPTPPTAIPCTISPVALPPPAATAVTVVPSQPMQLVAAKATPPEKEKEKEKLPSPTKTAPAEGVVAALREPSATPLVPVRPRALAASAAGKSSLLTSLWEARALVPLAVLLCLLLLILQRLGRMEAQLAALAAHRHLSEL
eukprot:TRINITY_DN2211_c2_g1_i3.p1 TRINITY_DN2211_c2_g1~~TRINITY_DN2211_c2_g1_i3.p1  ORF type:complete len:726 (+),score=190.16 TRINITY_DN2211_c2_g1_i3:240-2417(+)